jgi:pimeloyl-ACP methyl ester carboxylesterase
MDEMVAKTLYNYRRLDLDSMIHYFMAMPDTDITPALSQIQVPVLALTGDRDPIVPPDESLKIASMISNAESALIQGAGHMPFLERPAEYRAALSQWLAKTC